MNLPLPPDLAACLAALAQSRRRSAFDDGGLLHAKQLEAWHDATRWQAWPWGRRAGKTDLAEKLLLRTARAEERVEVVYVSTTIKRAVATIWDELVLFNADHELGGTPNHGTHTIRFSRTGSKVTVTGVEDKGMANDLRGHKRVALYVLDECQDWKDELLRYTYDQVVFPGLADVRGRVILCGTGGPPRGFWYRAAQGLDGWAVHTGTPFDNPFLPEGEAQALIDKACRDRGCGPDDPSILREFFARFVVDLVRQVFPFDPAKNAWHTLPGGEWRHVVAADVGTVDATAVGVIGWTDAPGHAGKLYLVEKREKRGLGAGGMVAMIQDARERYRDTLASTVVDPGGGGAGLIVDLQAGPHGMGAVVAAEKQGKPAACMTMRDALRTGRLLIPAVDEADPAIVPLATQLQTPEWDPDNIGTSLRGHMPDAVDMLLYGFRAARALNWVSEPAPPPPKLTVAEAMERAWAEADEKHAHRERDESW